MYITRISALQLAVVGSTGRGGSAPRGRDLPPGRAFVQEGRVTLAEVHGRGSEIDARLARARAAREIEAQNRLLAGRLLLLLDGAGCRRGQLCAGGRPVVALERGAEALRHRGGVASPVARAAAGRRCAGKRAHGYDRGWTSHVRGCTHARGRLPLTSVTSAGLPKTADRGRTFTRCRSTSSRGRATSLPGDCERRVVGTRPRRSAFSECPPKERLPRGRAAPGRRPSGPPARCASWNVA